MDRWVNVALVCVGVALGVLVAIGTGVAIFLSLLAGSACGCSAPFPYVEVETVDVPEGLAAFRVIGVDERHDGWVQYVSFFLRSPGPAGDPQVPWTVYRDGVPLERGATVQADDVIVVVVPPERTGEVRVRDLYSGQFDLGERAAAAP